MIVNNHMSTVCARAHCFLTTIHGFLPSAYSTGPNAILIMSFVSTLHRKVLIKNVMMKWIGTIEKNSESLTPVGQNSS